MNIAIQNSSGFAKKWIEYCIKNDISYEIVDVYSSNIIELIKDCDVFVWHHSHGNYKDLLFAKQLMFSLEHSGIKVFPNFQTGWHFDDKVGQKYLLESINAPLVPSYVFYDKLSALQWANSTTLPKVFKLRGGAGSTNVSLIRTRQELRKKIVTAFSSGFSQYDRVDIFKERWSRFKNTKKVSEFFKAFGGFFVKPFFYKMQRKEKGYIYFQDFIPNNRYDTRIVVIGDKAAGEIRFVRKNDFRASGSGLFSFENIDLNMVKIAFDISERLKLQSVAFDFIYGEDGSPLIVELSYGFGTIGISQVPGYWTKDLNFHNEKFEPENLIIDNLINKN
jgi:glutathione synthase/RimK-type ligase-like ATP-grasp enzyme